MVPAIDAIDKHIKVASFEKLGAFDQTSKDFDLSNIRGFIYGGISSRFWMLRKFINSYEFASSNESN